jgi:hypothetical protein
VNEHISHGSGGVQRLPAFLLQPQLARPCATLQEQYE